MHLHRLLQIHPKKRKDRERSGLSSSSPILGALRVSSVRTELWSKRQASLHLHRYLVLFGSVPCGWNSGPNGRPLFIFTDTWCSSGQFRADGTLVQTGGDADGNGRADSCPIRQSWTFKFQRKLLQVQLLEMYLVYLQVQGMSGDANNLTNVKTFHRLSFSVVGGHIISSSKATSR
jgi:hypothetical protein